MALTCTRVNQPLDEIIRLFDGVPGFNPNRQLLIDVFFREREVFGPTNNSIFTLGSISVGLLCTSQQSQVLAWTTDMLCGECGGFDGSLEGACLKQFCCANARVPLKALHLAST